MNEHLASELLLQRKYFDTGATRSYTFRRQQLLAMRKAVLKYEQEISSALYKDLKKSKEEAYVSETGLVLAELRVAISHLKSWMKSKRVPSDLANLPSKSRIYKDPLGVVLIISPWNYPLQLLLVPLVGAIAGGNCAVLKPSELAPATAAVLQKIINETFPPEYIKLVQGDGAEVVPGLMKSFRFDHVFYTGSISVGKLVYEMAASKLIPVTLELGGKSPAIVEQDANLLVAARRIALGKFTNAGQTCVAPDYVLVHEEVKNKFISHLTAEITRFYSDDASKNEEYCKIINEKRFDKLVSYLKEGSVIYGGGHNRAESFIAPTIMDDIDPGSELLDEEIFGPILPLYTYKNSEEAMAFVQRNENPLAFYLFTTSTAIQQHWINKLPFGGGCINNAVWHFTNHNLPFGGVGASGMGAYHGKFTFDTFTRNKPVMKTPNWFDPAIKYPPLKGKLNLFRWLIR